MRKHFLENISLKALFTSSDQGDFRIGSVSVKKNLTSEMLVRKRKSKNLS